MDGNGILLPCDLPAHLCQFRSGHILHGVVYLQSDQIGENVNADILSGFKKQSVLVLHDQHTGFEGEAVHSQYLDDLVLRVLVFLLGSVNPLSFDQFRQIQSSLSGFRPGSHHTVGLLTQSEGEADGSRTCFFIVADPAGIGTFSGFLIQTVQNRIHEQAALARSVLSVDRAETDIIEGEAFLDIVPVILHFDLFRHEASAAVRCGAARQCPCNDRSCPFHDPVDLPRFDVLLGEVLDQVCLRIIELRQLRPVDILQLVHDDIRFPERSSLV